jgi:hypothetical protein
MNVIYRFYKTYKSPVRAGMGACPHRSFPEEDADEAE